MPYSQKLRGLELLKEFGLPTPNWIAVTETGEIGSLEFAECEHGWTIRTCRTDGGRETGGFFANHCSPAKAKRILEGRLERFGPAEFYIVYPSWRFYFSCNILRNKDIYQVEGTFGSQKKISMGEETPDYSVRATSVSPSTYQFMIGERSPEIDRMVSVFLRYCIRIPFSDFYAEVAKTTDREVFFYDFIFGDAFKAESYQPGGC